MSKQETEKEASIEFNFENVISKVLNSSKNHNSKASLARNGISEKDQYDDDFDMDISPGEMAAIKEALEFKVEVSVSLYGDYEDSIGKSYSVNPFDKTFDYEPLKFSAVPVGVKVRAKANISSIITIKNDEALVELAQFFGMPSEEFDNSELLKIVANKYDFCTVMEGESEEKIITAGTNEIRITLRDVEGGNSELGDIPVDGTIDIEKPVKLTITIDQEKSDSKYYLNKGKIFFTLLDENGNDILEDVDWDAYSDIYGFINQNLLAVDCELYYGHNKINGLLNYGMNYLTMDNAYPLPKGGSYQLSLTISPGKRTYVNKDGDTVDFPDFEPVTGSFEVEVEDYLYTELDFTGIDSEGISAALTNALSGLTTGSSTVYFKLYGQTTEYYSNLFSSIKSAIANASSLFFIDASELTTTKESKEIGQSAMHGCSTVQGLILPEDVEEIYGQAFAYCSNLESVVFGRFLKGISTAFEACAKLSSVTFPEDSSFESLGSRSFSECSALKTFKLPASIKDIGPGAFYHSAIVEFTLEGTSGTWYYTFDSTTYMQWLNGELTPPSKAESAAEGSCGLVADLQTVTPNNSNQDPYTFPEGTSLTQKLTWLAKQTTNTNAEFTKEIYLFHKSE